MHEYSIAAALVARVAREVDARPGARVVRLQVRVGALAGVEAELLRTAFEAVRAPGPCAAAELAIASSPAAWLCPRCRRPIASGAALRCPGCEVPAELISGES